MIVYRKPPKGEGLQMTHPSAPTTSVEFVHNMLQYVYVYVYICMSIHRVHVGALTLSSSRV